MKSLTVWGEEGNENSHIDEIINGRKKAFCTPGIWFGTVDDEPETETGDILVLKDPSGKDRVEVKITSVRHLTFGEADEELARAVLDSDLQDFRDAHRFYWGEDIEVTESLPIVAEYFSIVKVL